MSRVPVVPLRFSDCYSMPRLRQGCASLRLFLSHLRLIPIPASFRTGNGRGRLHRDAPGFRITDSPVNWSAKTKILGESGRRCVLMPACLAARWRMESVARREGIARSRGFAAGGAAGGVLCPLDGSVAGGGRSGGAGNSPPLHARIGRLSPAAIHEHGARPCRSRERRPVGLRQFLRAPSRACVSAPR